MRLDVSAHAGGGLPGFTSFEILHLRKFKAVSENGEHEYFEIVSWFGLVESTQSFWGFDANGILGKKTFNVPSFFFK